MQVKLNLSQVEQLLAFAEAKGHGEDKTIIMEAHINDKRPICVASDWGKEMKELD